LNSLVKKTKIIFGKRLRGFRVAAGLSQRDFADFMNTGNNYISELENGLANPSFELLICYAAFFGVKYYQLGDPDFPIPSLDQLPASTLRKITELEKAKQAAAAKILKEKAEQKEKGLPGRAAQLHALINKGFFKQPKTARQVFAKLNPDIPESAFGNYTEELTKITGTLSKGRFAKLLDKLAPKGKSTAVRFRVKAVDQEGYENLGNVTPIAAEKK